MNQNQSTQKNEKGQGLVEYALLSAFVGLVVVGSLMAFGPEVKVIAVSLFTSVSGGFSVEDGNVTIPGISPTQDSGSSSTQPASPTPHNPPSSPTPTASHTPTASPTSTFSPTPIFTYTPTPVWTPTPTWTPLVILSPTPNTLACTPGSVNVSNQSTCSALSASNNCKNYTYRRWSGSCTWY
jgi:Flp pilus assembly pilin Flp